MATSSQAILRLHNLTTHIQPRISLTRSPFPASAWRAVHPHLARMSSQSIPKTMKGVLVEKTGGVEVLEYRTDLPVPQPKEGQLLIKNEVCGINYIDTFVTSSSTNSFAESLSLNPCPIPELLNSSCSPSYSYLICSQCHFPPLIKAPFSKPL